jgi:FkbM family methyltransferase
MERARTRDKSHGEPVLMDSIKEDLPLEDLPLNNGRKGTPASHSFATANEGWVSGRLYALGRLTMFCWLLRNWRAVWAQYRLGGRLPSLSLRNGLIVKHGPDDDPITLLEEVFWRRCYRREVTEPRHGVMIDIGANIGLVTLDWATRLPGTIIHAYEPYPPTFSNLISNLKANGLLQRVSLHNEAVGRSGGTMVFRPAALSSLVSAYRQKNSHASEEARVTAVSLDDVVARCTEGEAIRLLKIDTEGAEGEILEGASSSTLSRIDQMVVEYHDNLVPQARERCCVVLKRAGFQYVARPITPDSGLLYAWQKSARQ